MRHFIKIAYNNYSSGKSRLQPCWGFSAWIHFNNNNILFDTGGDGEILLNNLKKLDLDPSTLDAIFISHNHNDHTGGLHSLVSLVPPCIPVYIPDGMKIQNNKLHSGFLFKEISEPIEVLDNVWSTGPVSGNYKGNKINEQALVIRDTNNIWIITGCSHPGIGKMLNIIDGIIPGCKIQLVAGGFHLKGSVNSEILNCSLALSRAGVEQVAPSHCISAAGINLFKDQWKNKFRQLHLGDEYEIPTMF